MSRVALQYLTEQDNKLDTNILTRGVFVEKMKTLSYIVKRDQKDFKQIDVQAEWLSLYEWNLRYRGSYRGKELFIIDKIQ